MTVSGVNGMYTWLMWDSASMMNKGLYPQIETLFMTTDPKYIVLRSSSIRELASFHGDVSSLVPSIVAEALKKKYS